MKCSKCQGEMEEGMLVDMQGTGIAGKQSWGTSLKWGGMLAGVNNSHDVKTYKCKSCGYLESYAK